MAQEALTVRSQLIPLDSMRLVLPNTSIAEVVSHQGVEDFDADNVPQWVVGQISWRGIKLPLLSFESAMGENAPSISKSARVVVLNAGSHTESLPFYAIVSQGIPRLMALKGEAIIDAPEQSDSPYVMRHTLVDGNPAIIPNLEIIENELRSANISARELV